MRRLSSPSLFVFALLGSTVPAARLLAQGEPIPSIQTVPYPSVGASGGISIPIGGFSKTHVPGFNLSGVAEFRTPSEPLGVRGEVLYQYFGKKSDVAGATSSNTLGLLINVVYHMPKAQVRPYLIGGMGLYHISDQGNNAGLNVGTGVSIPLPGMTGYGEIRLHTALTQGPAYFTIPLTFGVTF